MMKIIAKRVPTALAIAEALGIKRIRPKGLGGMPEILLNWGNSKPLAEEVYIINHPDAVALCSDKLATLDALRDCEIRTVPYTTDPGEAFRWHCEGRTVYARSLRKASQGRGIILVRPDPKLGEEDFHRLVEKSSLFTRFVQADHEYRVHVFNGKVIDFAKKMRKRMPNPPPLRYWIRSHNNGWVLAKDNIPPLPPHVQKACISAVDVLGLHFGAVDVLLRGDKYFILEVNSAPGLEGSTLEAYVAAIQEYVHE